MRFTWSVASFAAFWEILQSESCDNKSSEGCQPRYSQSNEIQTNTCTLMRSNVWHMHDGPCRSLKKPTECCKQDFNGEPKTRKLYAGWGYICIYVYMYICIYVAYLFLLLELSSTIGRHSNCPVIVSNMKCQKTCSSPT